MQVVSPDAQCDLPAPLQLGRRTEFGQDMQACCRRMQSSKGHKETALNELRPVPKLAPTPPGFVVVGQVKLGNTTEGAVINIA